MEDISVEIEILERLEDPQEISTIPEVNEIWLAAVKGTQFFHIPNTPYIVQITGNRPLDEYAAEIEEYICVAILSGTQSTRGIAIRDKDLLKMMKSLGYEQVGQKGSHVHLKKESRGVKITIPIHGKELKKGTLKSILRNSGLTLETILRG
jgi:mRNA interferase HicA